MSEIGDRIRYEMELRGLSYGDLSTATGIYKSALQRYTSGTTIKIPANRLELIAQALNVSPEYLAGWSSERTKGSSQKQEQDQCLRLIDEITGSLFDLPEEKLTQIKDFVDFVKTK